MAIQELSEKIEAYIKAVTETRMMVEVGYTEIKKEIGLLGACVQGLSKGLANLTSQPNQLPNQLKPVDDSNLGFPKLGKPETWKESTTKQGDPYYWTSDPETVGKIRDMGINAPQGYKIYPDKPGSANYFPPTRKW
jgi:hypothetical protein